MASPRVCRGVVYFTTYTSNSAAGDGMGPGRAATVRGIVRIFIGVEGGIASLPSIITPGMHRYYWHQIFWG